MHILIASDHAGFELKDRLTTFLREGGHDVEDMGPATFDQDDDYPDFCRPLAEKMAQNNDLFGITIGYSGQGEAMVCNRYRGVRAAVYYGGNADIVRLSREHNNANVLSLGAGFLTLDEAQEAVSEWLETQFSDAERHARRIAKLDLEP